MADITTLDQIFDNVFENVEMKISYHREWTDNRGLVPLNAISHPDYRLILPHGKFAKSIDKLGRRVIFMGTSYGLVVFYDQRLAKPQKSNDRKLQKQGLTSLGSILNQNDKSYAVAGTQKLVEKGLMSCPVIQLTKEKMEYFFTEFVIDIRKKVEEDEAAGITINDGMLIHERKVPEKKHFTPKKNKQVAEHANRKQKTSEMELKKAKRNYTPEERALMNKLKALKVEHNDKVPNTPENAKLRREVSAILKKYSDMETTLSKPTITEEALPQT